MVKTYNFQLRTANINDLEILIYWDTQPHVIDSDPDDDWNWKYELKRFPHWREQLIAELEGNPLGLIQIIDPAKEESHYWGEVEQDLRAIDIWIGEKENLGKGYGTQIMQLAINKCFATKEVKAILVDPLETNIKAIRFYEKLGFKFIEKKNFGKSNCLVYKLKRKTWEKSTVI